MFFIISILKIEIKRNMTSHILDVSNLKNKDILKAKNAAINLHPAHQNIEVLDA